MTPSWDLMMVQLVKPKEKKRVDTWTGFSQMFIFPGGFALEDKKSIESNGLGVLCDG